MAAMWTLRITPLNVARKEAGIVATRTDATSERTYTVMSALLDTTAQKNAVIDQIWAMYQADLARETQIANFIGTLEAQGKANLEAREG